MRARSLLWFPAAFCAGLLCAEATSVAAPTQTAKAAPRAHAVDQKTGWDLDLAADGSVSSNHFAPAKLGGDGRLVIRLDERELVYRLAADGTVRHDDEVFGRFVDPNTFAFGDGKTPSPGVTRTITVADDGNVVSRERRVQPDKTAVVRETSGVWHIDAKDPVARRDALFALICEGDAKNPLYAVGAGLAKSKVATAVVVGAAVGAVAFAAYRVMATDVAEVRRRSKAKTAPPP